tara:strand:+ start:633 stop:854 length:222 start_codon:yes stop_codon:yes gene_type:complete
MARPVHVEVSLDEVKGDSNRLIRKFIKKVKKSGILELYREKTRFEKPSDKKRRQNKRKKQNAKKAQNLRKKRT